MKKSLPLWAALAALMIAGCETTSEQGSGVERGVAVTRFHLGQPIALLEARREADPPDVAGRLVFPPAGAGQEAADDRLDRDDLPDSDAQQEGQTFSVALRVVNRRLGTDFNPTAFRHRAFFDPARSRVEMHLESLREQRVDLGSANCSIALASGETIHTEISCKYTVEGFQALAARAGFRPRRAWTDPRGWFSVHYLSAP